ncbi:MAG TPA: metallophosphoesterase [Candidatus Saccharimonadales bacterium]|nr:metallophosphoesterase [Candidatus Saccharimonadales bacterium]
MIRRLSLVWPDARPFAGRDGRPIRWLVVSDDIDPALEHAVNRDNLGHIDSIIGSGDLEPDYLGFLGDAFGVPVEYVRGNHDRGGRWAESVGKAAPEPLATGRWHVVDGIPVLALEWPGLRYGDRRRHDGTAWSDVVRATWGELRRRLFGGTGRPVVIVSHAPPRGLGDRAADPYHVGFSAYRWLLDRLHPPLWLHGHVPPASVEGWRLTHDGTTVVNATGAVLLELAPPDHATGLAGVQVAASRTV